MISIFLLSFIQGISEFLPISSSFHLIIFRDIFYIGNNIISNELELSFDIALHFGTLLAVLIYFKNDYLNMFKSFIKNDKESINYKILIYIIISSIPAAIIGILFDDVIENFIRTKYLLLIIIFIFMGIIIFLVDKYSKESKSFASMNIKDSIVIGLSQIFSLIPGVSRSGMTITIARYLKLNREDAAKFSFYLSTPIIFGAVLLQLIKIDYTIIINYINYFIIGIITSFIVGLLSIKLLLKYVKNNDFKLFMIYRIILGLIIMSNFF